MEAARVELARDLRYRFARRLITRPAMSGADVACQMLAEVPAQKILFVSGYSETEAIKAIAPDCPLLSKPFRSNALSKAVRSALE